MMCGLFTLDIEDSSSSENGRDQMQTGTIASDLRSPSSEPVLAAFEENLQQYVSKLREKGINASSEDVAKIRERALLRLSSQPEIVSATNHASSVSSKYNHHFTFLFLRILFPSIILYYYVFCSSGNQVSNRCCIT